MRQATWRRKAKELALLPLIVKIPQKATLTVTCRYSAWQTTVLKNTQTIAPSKFGSLGKVAYISSL